ncbi:uncharacterized protein LOC106654644 isoform X2 [Trichogramma pretiosum]|uniref:uncharacterized protein LOC106654644 isoform X2 n=1 Tax=Trichogramma pretiosum TaxID=7493 RepID=UPI0006C95B16|nr:uncharacterized protein LOC106654644 isoform X2 [Trichogramma pretiosum]
MSQILMNQDYFRSKNNAEDIIKLQEFLINKNIRQENLENRALIRTMMRETAKKFADRQPMTLEIDTFINTIGTFTIDHLKEVKLFRINYGILTVACVEHFLYPGEDNEEYMKIYSCDKEKAIEVYRTLRGFPSTPDGTLSRSVRSFFNCPKFSKDNQYLEAIRSYLRSLQINNEDMHYIRKTSIELIDTLEAMNILERPVLEELPSVTHKIWQSFITKKYFLEKSNANCIIRLQNYLKEKVIEEPSLENNSNLINILHEGMHLFLNDEPSVYYLDTFRNTILDFTIDHLKQVELYRINRGILAVACIEHLLYPGDNIEEFMRIYSCDSRRATRIYNKLRGFSEDRIQDVDTIRATINFFNCENCLTDNDDYLSNIRGYLRALPINQDELKYIKDESRKAIDSTSRQEQHEFLRPQIPPPVARRPRPIARRPQPIAQPAQPHEEILLTEQYFCRKTTAHTIIRLVEYLNARDIEEQDLERITIVREILRSVIKKFADRSPTLSELHTFRDTIHDFSIDYLKEVNLFHINHGILVVACVEHFLYPTACNEHYLKIYNCSRRRATVLFNKLCGCPEHNKPDNFLVISTRDFFRSRHFLMDNRYLEAIRSYLEKIYISDDELTFIKDESIRIIYSQQVNEQPPTIRVDLLPNAQPPQLIEQPPPPNARLPPRNPQILITREYLQKKSGAQAIINIVNYLNDNDITEQVLSDTDSIRTMMRETMSIFADRNPTPLELNTFKNTILDAGIDYWTAVSLFRINHGILAVACVEHLLYPGEDNEQYMNIYGCNEETADLLYRRLCDLCELPVENILDDVTVKSAKSFFKCKRYIRTNNDYLSTIREYLGNLQIYDEELEYIKEKSIDLIGRPKPIDQLPVENIIDPIEDQPPAENIIDPVEDQPPAENIIDPVEDQLPAENIIDPEEDQLPAENIIDPEEDQLPAENIMEDQQPNLRENNEQPRASTPENHAPPPIVPIPVNHEFTVRYSIHQKIMANRMSNSFFWPAKIMNINNQSMTVQFYTFPRGERQVISSRDDIKSMEKETHDKIYASLPRELRKPFNLAVLEALGENVHDGW